LNGHLHRIRLDFNVTGREFAFPISSGSFSVEIDVVALVDIRVALSSAGAVTGVIGLLQDRRSNIGVGEFVFNFLEHFSGARFTGLAGVIGG